MSASTAKALAKALEERVELISELEEESRDLYKNLHLAADDLFARLRDPKSDQAAVDADFAELRSWFERLEGRDVYTLHERIVSWVREVYGPGFYFGSAEGGLVHFAPNVRLEGTDEELAQRAKNLKKFSARLGKLIPDWAGKAYVRVADASMYFYAVNYDHATGKFTVTSGFNRAVVGERLSAKKALFTIRDLAKEAKKQPDASSLSKGK